MVSLDGAKFLWRRKGDMVYAEIFYEGMVLFFGGMAFLFNSSTGRNITSIKEYLIFC